MEPTTAWAACLNPVVLGGAFQLGKGGAGDATAEGELAGWEVIQATDMQRHADRWLYPHDDLGDVCWPGQVNSSDGRLAAQCDVNRSSPWSAFGRDADPYAAPLRGDCSLKQITRGGLEHSRRLGRVLNAEYGPGGRHPLRGLGGCAPGRVFLAADAVEKNERTAEEVYRGLCGRAPSVAEFPAASTLVPGAAPRRGTPFWLRPGLCAGAELRSLSSEAAAALAGDRAHAEATRLLASSASRLTGQRAPASAAALRPFLGGLVDCAVCHACLGLGDAPKALLNAEGAPNEAGLFGRLDRAETAGVLWPYLYFRSRNESAFLRYARLHYGYYFVVLLDRMQAAVDAVGAGAAARAEGPPSIAIQVMSDTNLSPQLVMLGLDAAAATRPQWLATLVTELWAHGSGSGAEFAVRTLYNGRVQHPCPGQRGALCPWATFRALLARYAPDRGSCPQFYENYDLTSSLFRP